MHSHITKLPVSWLPVSPCEISLIFFSLPCSICRTRPYTIFRGNLLITHCRYTTFGNVDICVAHSEEDVIIFFCGAFARVAQLVVTYFINFHKKLPIDVTYGSKCACCILALYCLRFWIGQRHPSSWIHSINVAGRNEISLVSDKSLPNMKVQNEVLLI